MNWRRTIRRELDPSGLQLCGPTLIVAVLWLSNSAGPWLVSNQMLSSAAAGLLSEVTFWIATISTGVVVYVWSFVSSLPLVITLTVSISLGITGHDALAKVWALLLLLSLAVIIADRLGRRVIAHQ